MSSGGAPNAGGPGRGAAPAPPRPPPRLEGAARLVAVGLAVAALLCAVLEYERAQGSGERAEDGEQGGP